jgi:Uma2 family endonuclease
MTLAASPPPSGAASDALAPLHLPEDLHLTPDQFEQVCAANPEAVLELSAEGRLIVMTPTGSETGARNGELLYQLQQFAKLSGGWKVFDSSTGFHLPDGSIRSPDASLLRLERWQALTAEQRRGFAPLCPDLVVELASPTDEGPRGVSDLRRKMASYQANGARLGWLLLPHERVVEIWPGVGPPRRLQPAELLDGGTEFPGLHLHLTEIWAG